MQHRALAGAFQLIYEPKLANDAVSACRWSPCVSPHLPNLRLAPHWPPGRSAIEALRRGSCCSHERAHFPCHLCRHAQWTTRRRFITSRASSQLRANDDTNGHSAIFSIEGRILCLCPGKARPRWGLCTEARGPRHNVERRQLSLVSPRWQSGFRERLSCASSCSAPTNPAAPIYWVP